MLAAKLPAPSLTKSPITTATVGSFGRMFRLPPALRIGASMSRSSLISEMSSPPASTAACTVCAPCRLNTRVRPARAPESPARAPASPTSTSSAAMTSTFSRPLLAATTSSASTKIANGLYSGVVPAGNSPMAPLAVIVSLPPVVCT